MAQAWRLLEDRSIRERIIRAVRAGVPLPAAAKRAGVRPENAYRWCLEGRRDEALPGYVRVVEQTHTYGPTGQARYEALVRDFAFRIEVARAEWEAEHFENIATQALGKQNGQPQWKASAWILNNHPDTRKIYRQEKNAIEDRREPLLIYQQVAQLSDEELKALASGNDADPTPDDG